MLCSVCSDFLMQLACVLRVVELRISAATPQQFFVRALLFNFAVRNDKNAVRLADGGETVGDDERRAVLRQLVERMLNFRLGQAVQRRGRCV